jgi:hypothetical protein
MVNGAKSVRSGIPDHPINATEGQGFYVQGGYYFKDWKLQPWAGYEMWIATNALGRWRASKLGLTYFLKGQDVNLKVGYERVETEEDIGNSGDVNSGKDNINTFVVGLFMRF